MRCVYMETERERQAFAERAARCFAANPDCWTFSDGDGPMPGEWFALRWGLGDDCVVVFKVGDDEPVNYGQLIRQAGDA